MEKIDYGVCLASVVETVTSNLIAIIVLSREDSDGPMPTELRDTLIKARRAHTHLITNMLQMSAAMHDYDVSGSEKLRAACHGSIASVGSL